MHLHSHFVHAWIVYLQRTAWELLQVLRIASECPNSSSLHIMKSQAQQLFSMQPQADDLPKDIPDLGTLGNYLLTRQVALHLPAKLQILLHVMHTVLPCF